MAAVTKQKSRRRFNEKEIGGERKKEKIERICYTEKNDVVLAEAGGCSSNLSSHFYNALFLINHQDYFSFSSDTF